MQPKATSPVSAVLRNTASCAIPARMAHPATALPIPKQLSMPPVVSPSPALSRPMESVNSPPKPPSLVKSPLQPAANSEPVPQSQHAADSRVGTLQTTHNAPPSPAHESTTSKGDMTSGCAGHTSLRTHPE
ncbi:hypothetical protein FIBSPDRAFT_953763 [Athelia psychrophila]|uniref:Uncharacterized protein n=1 Tax=Athelia psychrophila TaxID=1759441 RepID=A0A166JVH9_9AGAM|nr:hypothetical protein FIBSPDRAFT_953763 [Fibularhizoctonia sp. CBS 109695]